MDPGKLEYYEFLDLSDIDENERQRLKQTLFSESTPDFLQLPWTNQNFAAEEWQKEPYDDENEHVPNGPLEPSCTGNSAMVGPNNVVPAVAQHLPAVSMYSQPPPPAYTMPPPSTGYQHPQNVFVSNVTANVNVHGYMTGHYMQPQPHYSLPEPSDIAGRGHRGRSRGRGSKRSDVVVEGNTSPGYSPPFVPIHYPAAAYYMQAVSSPMQHPSAQHATGSPLYIAPMHPAVYGAYQYYPPPGAPGTPHVNALMDDAPPDLTEMTPVPTQGQNQAQPMYQPQISEEDYESAQNVVTTTVIVNSSINQTSCDSKPAEYITSGNSVIPEPSAVAVTSVEAVVKLSATVADSKPVADTVEVLGHCDSTNTVVTKVAQQPRVHPVVVESAPVIVNNVQSEPELNVNSDVKPPQSSLQVLHTDPEPQEAAPVPPPSGKSWASLFNKSNTSATPSPLTTPNEVTKTNAKPLALVSPFSKTAEEKQTEKKPTDSARPAQQNSSIFSNDPTSHRMGEFLSKYSLDNRTVSLQPRGLTNRSNYCYINSILQALLACPPFYNLLKALPHQPRKNSTGKSPTPIIDSMVEFINEFTPLSAESRLNRKEKGQRKDNIDVICGTSFEPSRIYKILNGIRTDTFIVEGRQEDAEEFFGCLLNGLNDEMLELTKLIDETQNHQTLSNGDISANGDSHDQDEMEWKEIGRKNKGSITRRADFGRTPISDIFRGQSRSRVHRAGDQVTDNVQPFFTLQLDIEKANSVYEALEILVNKNKLEGVTCSRTNQQVEAWQQVTIEELPLVMVLHLKCFNYKLDACSKIIKALEFPIDLKIDAKLLSSKAKYTGKQKQYKLFAVVYHDGKEASKGHYLTDAYHVGYGGWVRYDDSTVKSVQETHVLHPNAARVPYLLYYRRCDTIGNQQHQQQNSSKKD